jgi:hypothetical protein
MTKHITWNLPMLALGCIRNANETQFSIVSRQELVEKSKELWFNLSKTLENHLKQLIIQLSQCNSVNTSESAEKVVGLPVPEPIWVQNLLR